MDGYDATVSIPIWYGLNYAVEDGQSMRFIVSIPIWYGLNESTEML